MADRLVRDEILDSDRYWNLGSDTVRMLFVHFLLIADDFGNAEATAPGIRRKLLNGAKVSDETIAEWLAEMTAQDLIRVYHVDGKRLIHIPRFRQRLRSYKRTNPPPPPGTECKEIKELRKKLSDSTPTDDGRTTVTSRTPAVEEKGSEGKGKEEKGSNVSLIPPAALRIVDKSKPFEKKVGVKTVAQATGEAVRALGEKLGVELRQNEVLQEYALRVEQAQAAANGEQQP